MKEEINYPIKYAVMPIVEQFGRDYYINNQLHRDVLVSHIVSKCYVLSEEKEYFKDGTSKISYRVLFPWQKNSALLCQNGNTLSTGGFSKYDTDDFINYFYSFSTKVDKLFDNFDDALVLSEELNKQILKSYLKTATAKTALKMIEQHKINIERYKEIEKQITEETTYMKVRTRA